MIRGGIGIGQKASTFKQRPYSQNIFLKAYKDIFWDY